MQQLQEYYNTSIQEDLALKLNYKNVMEIPKLDKIVLNFGMKNSAIYKKKLIPIFVALELLTNQRPILTKSRKDLITFKIRKNMLIGCKITLRKDYMYNFLSQLIIDVLPKLDFFKGFELKNDNLSLKIKEPLLFSQLNKDYKKFKELPPLDINIVLKGKNKQYLLSAFQIPSIK